MRKHSMMAALAMLAMASVGTPIAEPQRPRRQPKEPKLAGKKADLIVIDDIPPARTRAVVLPHPATKPKAQSDSLKRMLGKKPRRSR